MQLSRTMHRRALSSVPAVSEIKTVGVVGMGLMGHGIAQVAAAAGYTVIGADLNESVLASGKNAIESSVRKMAERKKKKDASFDAAADSAATLGRLSYADSIDALADCDLIVEAIVENADVKCRFYESLGRTAKPEAIFASNTSSLRITPMAEASGRADRLVGLHYFNPVQLMRLVEVVRTQHTDPQVFALVESFAQRAGDKVTVQCGDTPGFIVNRLLVPNLAQAIAMIERGDATVKDIDSAMMLGAGNPMGPIQLADYVGLDTCLNILDGWVKEYPDEVGFFVPPLLRAKVAAGKLGRKSGEGFYLWGDGAASTKPTGLSDP